MSEYGVSDEVIENCEEKLGKSPCLTSVSSFSGSDKPGENEEAVGENKFDLSSVDSNSNYWDKVREEIMRWFYEKAVTCGNPEDLVANHVEEKRKCITALKTKQDESYGVNLADRRSKRKMTIVIL